MTNFSLSRATLADLTATTVPPQSIASAARPAYTVKRLDMLSGRALECLAHAIEYIEDTTQLHDDPSREAVSAHDAIQLLKTLNRQIFSELPSAPPHRSLLRTIVAGWERSRTQGQLSA